MNIVRVHQQTIKLGYGLILLCLLVLNSSTARAQEIATETPTNLVVSLSADKAFFGAAEGAILHVTMTDPSDYSIRILKWFTPVEGVEEPLFILIRDGEPVTYIGKMVKRPAPTEQDYLTLKAGESITSDVDLLQYYDLSISGNYAVT
jgi:peptidyl-Lys metalloendopeptidase